mmetsp:Transcript_16088/g.48185  ORF Transcript_16088/g.48185 Transcript_16088/m.48185 type:complete len:352 (+) Transcript_16088:106-1161(+)
MYDAGKEHAETTSGPLESHCSAQNNHQHASDCWLSSKNWKSTVSLSCNFKDASRKCRKNRELPAAYFLGQRSSRWAAEGSQRMAVCQPCSSPSSHLWGRATAAQGVRREESSLAADPSFGHAVLCLLGTLHRDEHLVLFLGLLALVLEQRLGCAHRGDVTLQLATVALHCGGARALHAGLVEPLLPLLPDLVNLLHGLNCLVHKLPVILFRPVAPPLHLEGGILCKLLPGELPVGLGPLHLARVPLHLEVLVALRPAEFEDRCIIAHELDAVTRVHCAGAEPTLLQTHGCTSGAAPADSHPRHGTGEAPGYCNSFSQSARGLRPVTKRNMTWSEADCVPQAGVQVDCEGCT